MKTLTILIYYKLQKVNYCYPRENGGLHSTSQVASVYKSAIASQADKTTIICILFIYVPPLESQFTLSKIPCIYNKLYEKLGGRLYFSACHHE